MKRRRDKKPIDWSIVFIYIFFSIFIALCLYLFIFVDNIPAKIIGGLISFLFFYFYISTEIKNNRDKAKKERLRKKLSFDDRKIDKFIGKDLLELMNDTDSLVDEIDWFDMYSDYSFVLFPLMKAFEGFLKKVLLKHKIIKESDLLLNPNVSIGVFFHPKDGLINKRVEIPKRYKAIPSKIYTFYQEYRNELFHYDKHNYSKITFSEETIIIVAQIKILIVEAYTAYITYGEKIKSSNSTEELGLSGKNKGL